MRSTITQIQRACIPICSQWISPADIIRFATLCGVARDHYRDYSATRGGQMHGTHGLTAGLLGLALVMSIAGCDKPRLDIPVEKGSAGAFCITSTDCEEGLACLAEYCCQNKACANDCKSMLEKYIHLSPQARSIHPSVARELQRNCQKICCEGKTLKEIELELRQQSMQIPGHNSL